MPSVTSKKKLRKNHKAFFFLSIILLSNISGTVIISLQISFKSTELSISDPNICDSARNLYFNLADLTNQVLFGQQDANSYGLNASDMTLWSDWDNYTYSDVLTLTGSYPALYGFDVFTSANYIVPGIKTAFERGGVITVSWHAFNFVTGDSFYDTTGDVVTNILPGGPLHSNFTEGLDDIASNLGHMEHDGQIIPIIFRPWHEFNGNWFWWGAKFCSRTEFKSLFRFTVEYLRDIKGVHNFLYAFSPNQKILPFSSSSFLNRYPGDDVIDILALDAYDYGFPNWKNSVEYSLKTILKLASSRGKIAAFSETGIGGGLSEINIPNWYSDVLLNIISRDSKIRNIAYVMVWRNANFNHFWVPYPGHPQEAGFLELYNNEYTIFSNNLPDLYKSSQYAPAYQESAQTIFCISNITLLSGLCALLVILFVFGHHFIDTLRKKKK